IAGNGTVGFAGDGSSPTSSSTELNSPSGMTYDSNGNFYLADTDNYEIREVSGGKIETVAGHNSAGAGFAGDLSAATSTGTRLWDPSGVAVDSAGNIYIADAFNNVIRVVCQTQTPIACTNNAFIGGAIWAAGDINTFAGNNTTGAGYVGDGGPATGALLNNPAYVLMDSTGNLYISDSGNNAIRKVDTNGIITTIAGGGGPLAAGYKGDGGPATLAQLSNPKGLALDSYGNLYIADTGNSAIRVVEPNGIITTIAGTGTPGLVGDGGPATSAQLYFPSGVAVSGGKVYIADSQNNAIRLLTPGDPQINPGGVITAGAFGGSATVAPGSWIEIYGRNLAPGARPWKASDFNGSNAPTALDSTSVTVGGQPAYVAYISANQVNVQVPSDVAAGTQPLIVKTAFGASAAYSLTVGPMPGVYAPPSLTVGGKQYAGALMPSGTWVLPAGAVSGFTSQPAVPGDIITLYGVGFGAVMPNVPAGQTAPGQLNTLATEVQVMFGSTPATLRYQGLAPGLVGLYQLNVEVPQVAAGSAVPLTITQGGVTLPQTLYTAVGAAQ
ncbi:MAG: IPT/TIG domain-containing protein, partial [Bryobacteraceae bacterium]